MFLQYFQLQILDYKKNEVLCGYSIFMSELDVQVPTTFGMFCLLYSTPFRSVVSLANSTCVGFLSVCCGATDPFADAKGEDSGAGSKEYVHIRVQQRNGRKSLTTVQGLKKEFSYNKILKDLKKEFCCNGTVVQDPELGQVNTIRAFLAIFNLYQICLLLAQVSFIVFFAMFFG